MKTHLIFLALTLLSAHTQAVEYQFRQSSKGVVASAAPVTPATKTYATLDINSSTGSGKSLTGGNLTWNGGTAYIRSTVPMAESFYFEVSQVSGGYVAAGLTAGNANTSIFEMDSYGNVYSSNSGAGGTYTMTASYGGWPANIGFAWNAGTKTAFVYYNGVLKGSRQYSMVSGPVYPMLYSNGGAIRANFGATSFYMTAPTGYAAGVYQ